MSLLFCARAGGGALRAAASAARSTPTTTKSTTKPSFLSRAAAAVPPSSRAASTKLPPPPADLASMSNEDVLAWVRERGIDNLDSLSADPSLAPAELAHMSHEQLVAWTRERGIRLVQVDADALLRGKKKKQAQHLAAASHDEHVEHHHQHVDADAHGHHDHAHAHAHAHAHEARFDPPTGWLWGVPPGERPPREGWERITAVGTVVCALLLVVYTMKPDTSLDTWALEEARRRLEKEGILSDPFPGHVESDGGAGSKKQ